MGELFTLIPLLLQLGPTIGTLAQTGLTADGIVIALESASPTIVALLKELGAQHFPDVPANLQAVAVAQTAFDPNTTKWIQLALNKVLAPSPNLAVDGVYGDGTRAAVKRFQTQSKLTVDGWAGHLTQAALQQVTLQTGE
jgi:murein L,D-transpeptidase YcbB/YkuD